MRRLLFLLGTALAVPAVAQDADPDRHKLSTALLYEGQRAQDGKTPNLTLAIAKYKKAAEKAKAESNKDVAAEALGRLALCNERLDPENIAEAAAAWGEIASSYGESKPWGDRAREKIACKGVDVWLNQLHIALDAWRVTPDRSPLAQPLLDKKKLVWDKIQPLDKEAVAGLVWGLGHADEVVRDFAADSLAQVVDESGIAAVITRLNDGSPVARAGASAALQKIFKKWNDAAELDRRASELERDLATVTLQAGSRAEGQHKKLADEAAKLKSKAQQIRRNIPATLATAEIQGAIQKIIEDDGAHPQARREAALAALWIGRISGALVDAIIRGMDSKDRNVREACCRAAGGVDTSISTDKLKLADRLMKAVQEEPAKNPDASTADWANDEAVRQAAAEALEHVALVKTLPALIEALDDNDARVRHASFRALKEITRRDFEYDKDDKGLPRQYEPDKPLEERRKGVAKWEEWWKSTQGIVVLVERFWNFQSNWSQLDANKLFNPDTLRKEVASRKWASVDPKIDEDRVNRVIEEFQRRKDVFVQDAVDLGGEAVDQLLKFIGGETEKDGGKANAATRYFVAEAIARIVEKHSVSGAVEKVRDTLVQGDSPARKTGAALSLGFLSRDKIGAGEREALQVRGLGAPEVEVREASAVSLGKVGDDSSAADLTKAAGDAEAAVQIAALRALSSLHPKNADTIKALSDMVADEPDQIGAPSKKSANSLVREYSADALGAIGDAAAVPALLRARRDTSQNVREAARIAIQNVYKNDGKSTTEQALAVMKDEKKKTDDRSGAALLLGDTGEAGLARPISDQIIDLNPPRVLRDQDPGVRIKLCEALGNLKAKSKTGCERLLSVMGDDYEREAVRDAAYAALCSIFGLSPGTEGSPDKDKLFKASDPQDKRKSAVSAWTQYVGGQNLTDTQ